ncbi:MAG: hypothetical protein ACRER3_10090 [Pseudomonas fluorescens]|uniref:hypothetical protein n=1 Tax=Sphingopyxis sp. TaxID=1908224 RepID=UPI003D6CA1A7
MGAVSKLPKWIGFPASAGVGLIGVFAPDAFPEWASIYSFWLGVVLLAFGIAGSAWHFYSIGWFERNVWWRFKLSAPRPSSEMNGELSKPESRWMPMHEVFRHLAVDSRWSECASLKDGEKPEDALRKEFLDACARGDIASVGRVQVSKSPISFSAASGVIPKEFWTYAYIQPFYEILERNDARCVAVTEGKFSHVSAAYYCEICFLRTDVFSHWPKASQPASSRKATPFRIALNKFWSEATGSPNQYFDTEVDSLTTGFIPS